MRIRAILLATVFCAGVAGLDAHAQTPPSPAPAASPPPNGKIPKCRSRYGEKHLQELKKNLPGMILELEKIKRQARRLGRYLEDLERNIKAHPDDGALKKQKSDTEKEFEEAERQRFEKEHEIERAQAKIKELEAMDPCELPEPSPSPQPSPPPAPKQ
jgi:hypothetical protein